MSLNASRLGLGSALLAVLISSQLACGGESKSIGDALKADPKAEFEKSDAYKPSPKKRPPDGLPPPTDAEMKAWDRKDPEGEKHLYKFDKANMKKMVNYWNELDCFRQKMIEEGEKAFGVQPGSAEEEQWYQFKSVFIPFLQIWQQKLLANEPRIMEKSKMMGNFFEAHELVMNGYPKAYNEGDRTMIQTQDAYWAVVESKLIKYAKNIGAEWPAKPDLSDPKQKAAQDKFCEKAMNPPKQTAKKKIVGGGGGGSKKLDMGTRDF